MSTQPSSPQARRAHLLHGVLLAAAYFLAALACLRIVVVGGQVSPVWLPAGVAAVGLLVAGLRLWPAIWLAAFGATLTTAAPVGVAAAVATGNVIEAVVAVAVLRRLRFRMGLARSRDVLCLVGGASFLAPLASALVGATSLALAGIAPWSMWPTTLGIWWLGDAMGILLLAPIALTFRDLRRVLQSRRLEAAGVLALAIASSLLVFDYVGPSEKTLYAQAFILFPAAIWASLRLGPPGAAWTTGMIAALAIWGTAHGLGPFATTEVVRGVVALELFLSVLAMSSLLLAAVSAERQSATEEAQLLASALERDLRHREKMEEQLVLATRMASVGTLAAGVAHEINNPLTFVLANLELLDREVSTLGDRRREEKLRELLRDALLGAERVRAIVRDLRVFSRDSAREHERLELGATLEPAINMAMQAIKQRGVLVREPGPAPAVRGNPARLGQVFLNLLVNAAHALPEAALATSRVVVRTGTTPEGAAFVEIEDNGRGIPEDALGRIFEPFYTTKPSGEGTGLGLSICRQIVNDHGGQLEVRSVVGRGATFRVLLPAAPEEPAPVIVSEEVSQVSTTAAPARVLIVDDEVRLARSMKLLLEPDYVVETSHQGEEAVQRIAAGESFDLILCDLHMPGMTGMEVHARLLQLDPLAAERMIFLSGGAITEEARLFVENATNRILDKPIRPAVLLQVLQEELSKRAATGPSRSTAG